MSKMNAKVKYDESVTNIFLFCFKGMEIYKTEEILFEFISV